METKKRLLIYLILTFSICSMNHAQKPGSSFKEAIPVKFSSGKSTFIDIKDTQDYNYYNYNYSPDKNGQLIYTDGSVVFYRLQITEKESITIHNWGSPTLGFTTIFLVAPKDPTAVPDYQYNCDSVYDVALSRMGDCHELEKLNAPADAYEWQGYIHVDRLPVGTYYIITGGYKGSNGSISNGILHTTVILGSDSTDPEKPDPEEPDPNNPDPVVPDDSVDEALSEDHNYIQIITPNIAGESINSFSTVKSATRNILYYDDLGRPIQWLDYKASPSRKDIVSLQEYDWQGRSEKQWLPIMRDDGNTATFIESQKITSTAESFYQDNAAFRYPVYEDSPLNRVNEDFGPGMVWQVNGHSTKSNDRTNFENDHCLYFTITDTNASLQLELSGLYPACQLNVIETQDEDDHTEYTFINKEGQTILQRQIADRDTLDTYLIYDNLGNLCFIIPPAATDTLTAANKITKQIIDQYTYQYTYDERNRCIAKKLPACDWIKMIYDHADHLIFTQDGEQKKRKEWSFSFTDILDRVTLNGIYHGTPDVKNCDISYIYTDFTGKSTENYGYQINYYMDAIIPDSIEILQANYYDIYENQPITTSCLDYVEDVTYGKRYINPQSGQHFKDLLTGSIIHVLGSNEKLYARYYYDYNRNLIQSRHTSLNGKVIVNKALFNFNGKPTATCEEYNKDVRLLKSYTYDHIGRLTEETHCIGTDTTRIVYGYDEIGRAKKQTRIHKNDSLTLTNNYNIRGWLIGIDCPVFKETLHYTDGTGVPCYNGNISSMTWQSCLPPLEKDTIKTMGYQFTYDKLSRLKGAVYGEGENLLSNPNHFNEQVTRYDKMGNILGLKRFGQISSNSYGLIDNLSLNYTGNQLQSVTDYAKNSVFNNGFEFKDRTHLPVEYIYNKNGNLTKDLNKNITDIQYNILNLPNKIQFENGNSTTYLYDANGSKLQTTHITDGTTTTTDYCYNAIFENGVLVKLLTEYGYITLADNIYHYFILDHQGNNRVVINQNGEIEEINHYYPFGGVFASSTGFQPYKYNGKELDRSNGLDWYDYGARMYDAALGRWHAVDPLSEEYCTISPYSYCGSDPVNRIDPFGMDFWSTNDPKEIARFFEALRYGSRSIMEHFDFKNWNHATDSEFLGNLTFDDKTNTFYSSYGVVEDGVPTVIGVSIKALRTWDQGASIEGDRGRWYRKASGRVENVYPEYDVLFAATKTGWNIVKNMFTSMFRSYSTINTIDANKSVFVANGNPKNIKKISDKMLKQKGLDAHDIKYDALGKKAVVSHFDLYKDTSTGEILVLQKGGKGEAIHTNYFLK